MVRLDAFAALLTLAAHVERSQRERAAVHGGFPSHIRSILNGPVNDSELQRALHDAAMLSGRATCRTVKSISVEETGAPRRTRMDLIVDRRAHEGSGPIELGRDSYLLLVQPGKPSERLAGTMRKIVKSLATDRAERDPADKDGAEIPDESHVACVEMRLIAHTRLKDVQPFHLVIQPDHPRTATRPEFRIATWEAFLTDAADRR